MSFLERLLVKRLICMSSRKEELCRQMWITVCFQYFQCLPFILCVLLDFKQLLQIWGQLSTFFFCFLDNKEVGKHLKMNGNHVQHLCKGVFAQQQNNWSVKELSLQIYTFTRLSSRGILYTWVEIKPCKSLLHPNKSTCKWLIIKIKYSTFSVFFFYLVFS